MRSYFPKMSVLLLIVFCLCFGSQAISAPIDCIQEEDTFFSEIEIRVGHLNQNFPIGTELYVLTCKSDHFKNYTVYIYPFSQAQITAGKRFLQRMEEVRHFAVNDPAGPQFEDPTDPFTTHGHKYEISSGVAYTQELAESDASGATVHACVNIAGKFGLDVTDNDFCSQGCFSWYNGQKLRQCISSARVSNGVIAINETDELSKIYQVVDSSMKTPTHEFMHAIQFNSYHLASEGNKYSLIEESQANWFVRAKWLHILDQHIRYDGIESISVDKWGYDRYLFFSYLTEYLGRNSTIKNIMDYYRDRSDKLTVWEAHKKYISENFNRSISQLILEANIYNYTRQFYFPVQPDFSMAHSEILKMPYQKSVPMRNPNVIRPSTIGVISFKISKEIKEGFLARVYFEHKREFSAALFIKYPYGYQVTPFKTEPDGSKSLFYRLIPTAIEAVIIIGYGDSEGGYHFYLQENKPSEKIVDLNIDNMNNRGWQLLSVPVVPKFPIPNSIFSKHGATFSVLKDPSRIAVVDGYIVGAEKNPLNDFPRVFNDSNNVYIGYSCPGDINDDVRRNGPDCLYLSSQGVGQTPSLISLQGVPVDKNIVIIPLVKGYNLIGNPSIYSADFSTDIKIQFQNQPPVVLSDAIKMGHVSVYPVEVDKFGPKKGLKYSPRNDYIPKPGEAFWLEGLREELVLEFQ